jgi:hypothetical protein
MKKIKSSEIFEGSFRTTSKQCIEEGYKIATLSELGQLIKSNKIPKQYYNTGEVLFNYKIRKITKEEIYNIDEFIKNGGRVAYLYNWYSDSYFSACNRSVDDGNGRLVGVKYK